MQGIISNDSKDKLSNRSIGKKKFIHNTGKQTEHYERISKSQKEQTKFHKTDKISASGHFTLYARFRVSPDWMQQSKGKYRAGAIGQNVVRAEKPLQRYCDNCRAGYDVEGN